eukprot:21358-Amphidinium_carterae.1
MAHAWSAWCAQRFELILISFAAALYAEPSPPQRNQIKCGCSVAILAQAPYLEGVCERPA